MKTERAEIIEKAKLDIVDVQTGNMGKFTEKELIEILNKYGTLSNNNEETILDKTLTTTDERHEIKVSEIWNVPFESTIVKFNISGLDYTSYNGDYEVENGTTWEEFINATFPQDFDNGWHVILDTGYIIANVGGGGYIITYQYLCDSNENAIKRNDIIANR